MKLLITGIAGFIGSKIAQKAIDLGYQVIGIDDLSNGYTNNIPQKAEFIKYDLSQRDALYHLPKDIDYVLHLAGQSSGEISFDDPVVDLEKNTVSTLNLINYSIKNNIKKFLYASSMSVYGLCPDTSISEDQNCNPLSCYGVGKLAAENYLKIYQNKLPFVSFRMFNVYGPGQDMANLRQGMVSIYLAYILKNKHIPIKGSVERFRDFIYIDDVVKIWLEAIHNDLFNNQYLNVGTGIKTTIKVLLDKIKLYLPDFSIEEIQNTQGDQFGIYADNTKIKNLLKDFSFHSLEEGLAKFVQCLKNPQ